MFARPETEEKTSNFVYQIGNGLLLAKTKVPAKQEVTRHFIELDASYVTSTLTTI